MAKQIRRTTRNEKRPVNQAVRPSLMTRSAPAPDLPPTPGIKQVTIWGPAELVGPVLVVDVHATRKEISTARRAHLEDRKTGRPVWVLIIPHSDVNAERIERRVLPPPRSPRAGMINRQPGDLHYEDPQAPDFEEFKFEEPLTITTELLENLRQIHLRGGNGRLSVRAAAKQLGVDRQTIRRAQKGR